ncbi:alpha-(1,6)-fucosyltransferase-like [Penaeus indicus]|uniref:alpha-(1,6)-fucosyltransferase-like n=1 Tax=Penaeus indicus TaxID=29960 RepID=UPI00300C9F03
MLICKSPSLLCSHRGIFGLRLSWLLTLITCSIVIVLLNSYRIAYDARVSKSTEIDYSEMESSKEKEQLLRQIGRDLYYTKQYISGQLQLLKQTTNSTGHLDTILEDMNDYFRVLRHDLNHLRDTDGASEWRWKEAEALSELVQHRIHVLQHPKDCNSARKLHCEFSGGGRGVGSQFHHLTICFVAAYATQRTLLLKTEGWFNTPRGLDTFFLPLSNSCTKADMSQMVSWPGTDSLLVGISKSDHLKPKPYSPLKSIPRDLSERLFRLHGDPYAWWVGQFFKYTMRMNSQFEDYVRELAREIGYESPIVGIQVRRTDKTSSGLTFIPLKNFMDVVAGFYDDLELRQEVGTRRVFVATDDPSVIEEAKEKYPDYQFVYNEASIVSADLHNRWTESNLRYYLADIYFLSRSNYLVCTMSSNMCRFAYEVMQTVYPDASLLTRGLELPFYFMDGQGGHILRARFSHVPRRSEEMGLQVGDKISVSFKYYYRKLLVENGFLYGVNLRTSMKGLFPVYKTVDVLDVVDFSSFEEIDRM